MSQEARARVTVALEPDEVLRGAEVRVSLRAERKVARIFMRIVDTASGVMAFRTMRVSTRPTRGLDLTVGTRWFPPDRRYVVQASAYATMAPAGSATLSVSRRRSAIPLALLVPMLLWGVRPGKGVARAVSGGRPIEPVPRLPPVRRGRVPSRPRTLPPSRAGGKRFKSAERGPRVRDAPRRAPILEVEIPERRPQTRKAQDPWATGTYYTRAQVESVLNREREKRKQRPWLRPLPEGSVEEVMDALRRDFERRSKKRLRYDLDRPVKHYLFRSERDARVCRTCLHLDGGTWAPWEYRPAIPIHPNCRCHYERAWAPARQRPERAARALKGVGAMSRA